MAISKIIYKSSAEDTGTVWMDTTDKTVAADKMVSGITALKNDGTTVTGNLTSRSSSDLTASGATVTVPAGVYSSQASKAVSSGSATAPASISGTSATVSTGTNTLTLTKTVSVTPSVTAGYVSSGTAGNSSVSLTASVNTRSSSDLSASGATVTAPAGYYANSASKSVASGTVTAPSTISGSSATVSTGTNTLTLSKTVSVTPSVTTAGYVSSGTAGNSAVSLTASVNTRSSSDLTASTLTVTAPAGYYGSDATKTLSDQNLLAENIKKDISIFGVTGSYEGGGSQTTWEQVYSGSPVLFDDWGNGYSFVSIPWTELIALNSVWRVTWDNLQYECTATYVSADPSSIPYGFGNYTYDDGTGGTDCPFFMQAYDGDILYIVGASGSHSVLIEKQVPSGGGGLEYETGTYTPTEDVASTTISFANTHNTKPCLVLFADITSAEQTVNYSEMMFLYGSIYEAFGSTANSGSRTCYSIYRSAYRATSQTSLSSSGSVDYSDTTSQVSSTGINPSSGSSNYFRTGRTYKWIAVWAPST